MEITDVRSMYIGGDQVAAHATRIIPVINPATELQIGSIVDGDEVDVDRAVRVAHDTFKNSGWAQLAPAERATYIRRLADAYDRRGEQMARLVSSQNGMPITMALAVMRERTSDFYRYFAELADALETEEVSPASVGHTLVRREPIGVVGIIVPWNGPQSLIAWKLGPAMAAGCTVVIKPAPETTLDAYLLMEAVEEAGIPAGVVNVVSGDVVAGSALVQHPLVRKIAFTGSSETGKIIAAQAGSQLKPVTLELGGKSAAILLDDADLDEFGDRILQVCLPNTGQVCNACTRVLAPRDKYDDVVELTRSILAKTPIGDPTDPASVFGPLTSSKQRDRVESYIAIGKNEGAQVVLGGGRPLGLDRGFYVEPTLFAGANNAMRIAQEEIFGPVLTVIPYDGEEEAIAIANDSDFGLGGAVFSADLAHATEVARRLETGSVGVGQFSIQKEAPYGGVKQSGLGRELGRNAVEPYLTIKTIYRAGAA